MKREKNAKRTKEYRAKKKLQQSLAKTDSDISMSESDYVSDNSAGYVGQEADAKTPKKDARLKKPTDKTPSKQTPRKRTTSTPGARRSRTPKRTTPKKTAPKRFVLL